MENASKALIIAGAILLSILIISLGIVVVTNSRATIDKANVNQTEAETHNSKFEAYCGTGKTPTEVKQCMSTVFSYNGTNAANQTDISVFFSDNKDATITDTSTTLAQTKIPTNLSNGKTYKISILKYDKGYVNIIAIQAEN